MTAAPPPLAPDLTDGLRRLKLAAMRRLAPELLLTARTQRWAPEELLRTLVEAEISARDASNARTRLKSRRVPGDQDPRRVRPGRVLGPAGHLRLPGLAGMDHGPGEPVPGRAGRHGQEPPAGRARRRRRRRPGTRSATSPPPSWSRPSTAAWPTTPSAGSSTPCSATTSSWSTRSGSPRWTTPARSCCSAFVAAAYERRALGIASHWPFDPGAGSCPSTPPPSACSTGSCTTRMSWSPTAIPTACAKPEPGRGTTLNKT